MISNAIFDYSLSFTEKSPGQRPRLKNFFLFIIKSLLVHFLNLRRCRLSVNGNWLTYFMILPIKINQTALFILTFSNGDNFTNKNTVLTKASVKTGAPVLNTLQSACSNRAFD